MSNRPIHLAGRKGGFTLIELLVVIAIIGILSSVILVSLSTARMRARDARRMSDLQEISKALQMYYIDNGKYPPSGSTCGSPTGYNAGCFKHSNGTGDPTSWPTLASWLSQYIPTLPSDPINTTGCNVVTSNTDCYEYAYGDVGLSPTNPDSFELVARLEDKNSQYRCGTVGYKYGFSGKYYCAGDGGAHSFSPSDNHSNDGYILRVQ